MLTPEEKRLLLTIVALVIMTAILAVADSDVEETVA